MLKSLRSSVKGVFAKLMLALLFLSFAAWGVGDMAGGSRNNKVVATVGDAEITVVEFSRAMQNETNNIRNMMGENYSQEALQSMNIPSHVVQGLVTKHLLMLETKALGIIPSDKDVVRRIQSNPAFSNAQGQFDKQLFKVSLSNIGRSEKDYVNEVRNEIAVNLLLDSVFSVIPLTKEVAPIILKSREHKRKVELYSLNKAPNIQKYSPTQDQIENYYKGNLLRYTVPEMREVSYVTITQDNVTLDDEITDEAIKKQYEERMSEFTLPEKRHVEQLLLSSEDLAKKAHKAVAKGEAFSKAAPKVKALNENTTDMGLVGKANIIEEAAEAVFSLKEGAVSQPVKSPFGWHIFKVTKIQPAKTLSLKQVRGQIKNEVEKIHRDEALVRLANEIEDALAGGAQMSEIATEYKLEAKKLAPFNKDGIGTDDKFLETLPNYNSFKEVAFQTEEETSSSVISSGNGVFFLVRVDKVIPEHPKPLELVKADVVESLKQIEKNAVLKKIAQPLSEEFSKKGAQQALIKKYNLKSLGTYDVSRNTRSAKDIATPPQLISEIFQNEIGQGTNAYFSGKHGFLVAIIKKDIPAPSLKKNPTLQAALQSIKRNLSDVTRSEILDQYAQVLEKKYEVTINNELIKALMK